ncbi:MAG: hypothetical protein ChlgKO_04800 [Chlamydiales bacterium]
MLRKKLYFCNTYFEWELEQKKDITIEEGLRAHPLFFQLHHLPLLFAEKTLLAPEIQNKTEFANFELVSYAPSRSVQKWAQEKNIPYNIPPLDLVKTLTSKIFSFENAPQLPGSAILYNAKEATAWLAKGPFPKVLKTPFGFAARGHTILQHANFDCSKLTFPLIGEPWVKRQLDFSMHFEIGEEIRCVGKTLMQNDQRGSFLSCKTGADIPEVNHLPLLEKIQEMGFFGPISIDSFVYDGGIHPVVEINPRHTMSSIACKIGVPIKFTYGKDGDLLPSGYAKNLTIVKL